MKNIQLHIKGNVQGVGFRYTAKSMARSLGLCGFAKNLPDETVYIEIEGEDNAVKEFTRWCHRGPERASVDEVIVEEGEIKHYSSFETKF